MTEFKSFSRWSALLFSLAGQREKERMGWAGVLLLSQMAVAGPTDVLVSASGYIQRMSWSSTYALIRLLHSAAFKMRMTLLLMMTLLPSNNFKFKDQIWFIQENK